MSGIVNAMPGHHRDSLRVAALPFLIHGYGVNLNTVPQPTAMQIPLFAFPPELAVPYRLPALSRMSPAVGNPRHLTFGTKLEYGPRPAAPPALAVP